MWLRRLRKSKWSQWCFRAFIFTLPFQSSLLIYETDWGRGFSNPYTLISFSLSESFLLLSTALFLFENHGKSLYLGKKNLFWTLLLLLSSGMLSLLLSPVPDWTLKFFLSTSLLELLLIYFLIVNKILKVNEIFRTFTWTMCFQAALAILQLLLGHSLGFSFLGEPSLSQNTPHLAKLSFSGWELIRSYGTLAHPNILGGFLALSILGTLLYSPPSKKIRNFVLALQIVGLICSFSRSAISGLIFSVLVLSYRSVPLIQEKYNRALSYGIFALVFFELLVLLLTRPIPLLTDPAVQTRLEGYERAVELVTAHPFGVGWNLETLFLDENSSKEWMPWDYQPTHNIVLLGWAETGLIGVVSFIILLITVIQSLQKQEKILGTRHEESKKNFFFSMGLFILCTGMLDHYWITLEPARFLAMILFASISRFLSDPIPIKAIKSPKKLSSIQANPK